MSDPTKPASLRELVEKWRAQNSETYWDSTYSVGRSDQREVCAKDLAPFVERWERMERALRALPLEHFGEDMSKCDAADFVDHAGEFFEAMLLARAALAPKEPKT